MKKILILFAIVLFTSAAINKTNSPGYNVYTAVISQESEDDPFQYIKENGIGLTIKFERIEQGIYKAFLSSPVNFSKLIIQNPLVIKNLNGPVFIRYTLQDSRTILIESMNNYNYEDEIISNDLFEIRLYP